MNKILSLLLISGFVLIIPILFFVTVYPDQASQLDDAAKDTISVLLFIGTLLLITSLISFAMSELNLHGFKTPTESKD